MRTTKIKCNECGKEFEKRNADYNRTKRLGEKHFCNLSCSAKYRNKNETEEQYKRKCKRLKSYRDEGISGRRTDEYSPFREFMRRCKSKERIQNYGNPDIDLSYLKETWELQNGICPYTGIKMILPKSLIDYDRIHSPKKASLDRIDSSRGYIKGNVEFVCSSINLGKNSFTREEMKKFISEIIPNHI